jgi:putative Mg2+ transporter-C (MgtC) family protein
MDILEITLKLLLAVALGGLIGIERESSKKPAGFRTNILICIGATMMMILSKIILEGQEGSSSDSMRMAAGVITGIGFIGAGTIIQARGMIVGLTTAATLWAVAGLGLVIGAGYYLIAAIFTIIIILTLILFRLVEEYRIKKALYRYKVKFHYAKDLLPTIKRMAFHDGIKFNEIAQKREEKFSVLEFTFFSSEEKEQKFVQSLSEMEEIQEIKID